VWVRITWVLETGLRENLKLSWHMTVPCAPHRGHIELHESDILPESSMVRRADRTPEQTAEIEEWAKSARTNEVKILYEQFLFAVGDRTKYFKSDSILFRLQ